MSDEVEQINYIVKPGLIERLYDDGEACEVFEDATDLYDEMILNGYQATDDPALGGYYIDLAVRPHPERGETIVVFTSNPAREIDMGRMSGLFLGWRIAWDHGATPWADPA